MAGYDRCLTVGPAASHKPTPRLSWVRVSFSRTGGKLSGRRPRPAWPWVRPDPSGTVLSCWQTQALVLRMVLPKGPHDVCRAGPSRKQASSQPGTWWHAWNASFPSSVPPPPTFWPLPLAASRWGLVSAQLSLGSPCAGASRCGAAAVAPSRMLAVRPQQTQDLGCLQHKVAVRPRASASPEVKGS